MSVYQEHSNDTWNHNGTSYNLNKIFQIAHGKEVVTIDTKEFENQVRRSQKEVDGELVCGSCYGHTNSIETARKHHNERVEMTDSAIPILVMKEGNDWRVIDGAHRVEKALLHSIKQLPVILLHQNEIDTARRN